MFNINFNLLTQGDKLRYRKAYHKYLINNHVENRKFKIALDKKTLEERNIWVKKTYGLDWEDLTWGEKITYGREYKLGTTKANKFFISLISKVPYEELYDYYIIKNHNGKETCDYFNISSDSLTRLFLYYNIRKDRETINKNISYKIKKIKNHKIDHIEFLSEVADVYDITVQDNHNFALDAGVFVHNSKDQADSVTGALYNASLNIEEFVFNYGEDLDDILNVSTSTSTTSQKQQIQVDFEQELQKLFTPDTIKQQQSKDTFLDFGEGKAKDLPGPIIGDGMIIW